jgi:hypothetical protein
MQDPLGDSQTSQAKEKSSFWRKTYTIICSKLQGFTPIFLDRRRYTAVIASLNYFTFHQSYLAFDTIIATVYHWQFKKTQFTTTWWLL